LLLSDRTIDYTSEYFNWKLSMGFKRVICCYCELSYRHTYGNNKKRDSVSPLLCFESNTYEKFRLILDLVHTGVLRLTLLYISIGHFGLQGNILDS
jgi:hypothetical protein